VLAQRQVTPYIADRGSNIPNQARLQPVLCTEGPEALQLTIMARLESNEKGENRSIFPVLKEKHNFSILRINAIQKINQMNPSNLLPFFRLFFSRLAIGRF